MSEPLIEAEGIEKRFGKVEALAGVDISVEENEVMGLVGDNGAGKSTLIKCLIGVHEPDGGVVRIKGEEVEISSPKEAKEYGIATVYQDLALVDKLTVSANVYLGRVPTRSIAGFIPKIKWEEMENNAQEIIKSRLDLDIDPEKRVEFLSGGERQAVAIARALVTDPDILILDEPTAALSQKSVEKVQELVRTLQEDEDITIILISHSMEELFELADRLTILHSGRNVDTVDSDSVTKEDIVTMMVG
jgi:ABC-type sugar transport system ATPase subunit